MEMTTRETDETITFGWVVFRLQHQQVRLFIRPKRLAGHKCCYRLLVVRLWQSGSLKRLWLVVILALRQATGEGAWLECGAEPGRKGT